MVKQDQPLDYLVVLDFEATCDETNQPSPQKIIKFPSVLVSMKSFEPVDEFISFVRPQHHPQLTQFCINLTGIKQKQIDAAPNFPEVLEKHLDWLRSHNLPVSADDKVDIINLSPILFWMISCYLRFSRLLRAYLLLSMIKTL